MLVSQMSVCLHRQNTAVFVSEPFRHGGNVHARFDAPSCEQMSQIVVRQMMKAELLAGACQRPLEFANAENRRFQKLLLAPRFLEAFQQLPHLGDHGNTADFPILGASLGIATNNNLVLGKVAIPSKDASRFFQAWPGVSEELDGVSAMFAESAPAIPDCLDEREELIRLRQSKFLAANPRAAHFLGSGGVVIPNADFQRDVEDSTENGKGTIDDGGGVPGAKRCPPVQAILFGDSLDVCLFEPRPSSQERFCTTLVVFFRAFLDFGAGLLPLLKQGESFAKCHPADDLGVRCSDGFMFGIQDICQA